MSDANPSAAFHRNALQYLYLHELEQSALRANGLARGTGFEISPRLIRFSHTIFALPFALGAPVVAANGWPSLKIPPQLEICPNIRVGSDL